MITLEDFLGWVDQHCAATAAPAEAAVALVANRAVIVTEWASTRSELSDCTARLVAKRRVPKFANEHSDAIGNELHHLRQERGLAQRPDPGHTSPAEPYCDLCRDTGFVTVPHPLCVEVPRYDPPRLVPYRDRDGIRYGAVVEVSVLCDRGGCAAGRRTRDAEAKAARPRPTFAAYMRPFGGLDLVGMLAHHNRECAAHCRRTAGPGRNAFADVVARIAARVTQSQGEAA